MNREGPGGMGISPVWAQISASKRLICFRTSSFSQGEVRMSECDDFFYFSHADGDLEVTTSNARRW
jgi:hypothetical protein